MSSLHSVRASRHNSNDAVAQFSETPTVEPYRSSQNLRLRSMAVPAAQTKHCRTIVIHGLLAQIRGRQLPDEFDHFT